MSWEGRSCNDYPVEGRSRGTLIYGTEGTALLDGDEYIIYDKNKKIIKQAKGKEVVDPTNTVSGEKASAIPGADAVQARLSPLGA